MDNSFLTQAKRTVQYNCNQRLSEAFYGYEQQLKGTRRILTLAGPAFDEALGHLPYLREVSEENLFEGPQQITEYIVCDIDTDNFNKAKNIGCLLENVRLTFAESAWDVLNPEDWTRVLDVSPETGLSNKPIRGFDLDFCAPLKDDETIENIAQLIYSTGTSPCWIRLTNSVGRVNTQADHNYFSSKLIELLTNNDLSELLYLDKQSYLGGASNTYPMRVLQLIIQNRKE